MKLYNWVYWFRDSLRGLVFNRPMTLASIVSLTTCFLLAGCGVRLLLALDSAADRIGRMGECTVYLKAGEEREAARTSALLQTLEGVQALEYFSREANLLIMCELLGEDPQTLLEQPGDNPFLASCRLQVEYGRIQELMEEIENLDQVEAVTGSLAAAELVEGAGRAVLYGGTAATVLLGAAAALIIANTMKLTTYARRREIAIMRAVGAADSFIRMPFILEGTLIGLLASFLAVGALYGGELWLENRLLGVDQQRVELRMALECMHLPGEAWLLLLCTFAAAGCLVGGVGAGWFVREHLRP